MTTDELIDMHADRAMAELDQALSAASIPAAQAHYTLSSLHLDRMRSLRESRPVASGVRGH